MTAERELQRMLEILEHNRFSGYDYMGSDFWVESEYEPGKLKLTLTEDYDKDPSVLELILDDQYYVTGVVQIMDGVPIHWAKEKVMNSQLKLLDYLLMDPRFVLYHRENPLNVDTGSYLFDVGGPAMRYLRTRGLHISALFSVGSHGPTEMQIWKKDDGGNIELIKDIYFV